jgi:hypothetical protein
MTEDGKLKSGRLSQLAVICGLAGAVASVVALVPEFGQWLYPSGPVEEAGDSPPQDYSTNSTSSGTLAIRRPIQYNSAFLTYEIVLNERQVGYLKNGQRKILRVEPGLHRVYLRNDSFISSYSRLIEVTVRPGEIVTVVCSAQVSTEEWILCRVEEG